LKKILSTGILDFENFKNQIQEIKKHPVQLIICTCTTYGQACDKFKNVERIDQPLVEYLVSNYSKIAMAYSAASTKKTSKTLLQKSAASQNKKIAIIECDCTSSWQYFEVEDIESYEKSIAQQIKKTASNADVVFLAQASMEGAIKYLEKDHREFISSGEYGVKKFLERVS